MSTLAPSTAVAGLQRPLVRPSASATATAPLSTGSADPLLGDSSFSIGDTVEQMDASVYSLEDTSSQAVDDAASLHSASLADLDLKSYDLILSVVLADLGQPELLVRAAPKPRSFWELEPELPVQAGGGALALDMDMQTELIKAFSEPSTLSRTTVSSSARPWKRLTTPLWRLGVLGGT